MCGAFCFCVLRYHSLLKPTLDFADFKDVDMVIEAVPEIMDLKKQCFLDIERLGRNSAVSSHFTAFQVISRLDVALKQCEKSSKARANTKPDCLICTNTSGLNIDDIAAVLKDPSRAAGLLSFCICMCRYTHYIYIYGIIHIYIHIYLLSKNRFCPELRSWAPTSSRRPT